MTYTPLDLMGVVVQWSSCVLLLALFFHLRRFGARRRVLRLWAAAWAAQVISITGFLIQSIAVLAGRPLPLGTAVLLLDDLYAPAKLLFGTLVALGALETVGWRLRPAAGRLVILGAILVGVVATWIGSTELSGAIQLAVTVTVFFGVALVVARRERVVRNHYVPFLAAAMFLFGAVTATYQAADYLPIGTGAAAQVVRVVANTSGYGDALVAAILGAAIVVLLIEEAFRTAEHARSERLADLAASEARLTGIIEAAREAIMTVDAHGIVGLANATAERRFGLTARGALGRPLADFVVTEHPLMTLILRALATSPDQQPPTATLAAEGRRADGTRFPLEFTVGPLDSDIQGGSVVILRDLSAKQAADTEREQFERRMAESEKMLAIGRVVSGVAHELNNPLAVVLGQSEQLVDAVGDADVRSGLQLINEQAHRARHIVKDLLMFVRHRDAPRETVDLAQIIQRVVASQRSVARARGVRLVTKVDSKVRPVLADRNGVEQVLTNLLDNAFDAAGVDGKVSLILSATAAGAEIAVEDSGVGVPDDMIDRIFEPFFTTKPIGHGTGLGLAVSLGVAQRNSGSLRLENHPAAGIGARFVLLTPYSDIVPRTEVPAPPARTITMPKSPRRADGTAAPVLLIDDESAVRSTLSRIFQRAGWLVQEAATGEDGLARLLDAAADQLPAVILCDMKMPGMGGRDVYLHLKERRPELLSRLIFVTGDVVEASAAAFLGSTKAFVVEKPFTVGEIARAVGQVMMHHEELSIDGSPR